MTDSPPFVNAHCHLELSGFSEPVRWNGSFPDWIAEVLRHRNQPDYSVETAVRRGEAELLQTGTVAAADIVQTDLPAAIPAANPRLTTRRFLELIAWTPEKAESRLARAEEFLQRNPSAGLSPHAPYTVCPELLDGVVSLSRKYRVPVAMHLAETPDESELLRHHCGPLLEMMRRADPHYNPKKTLSGGRPLDYLKQLSQAHRVLVIHGNDLDEEEIGFLASRRDNMSAVFCPVAHRYFGRKTYPLRQMSDAGVLVALGTDSRASWTGGMLSMRETVRVLLEDYPEMTPEEVLPMATVHGLMAAGLV
ncbi:MAG: amidohydrolase family protein [Planctomycetaceae bacterium]|jgi:cytosine/adenosine deaminase-related metal-dependent hydrolase|nr:amidohydrolase family protein [Planctomycetaceae bacterium]